MKGCLEIVKGDFYCYNCNLSSLEDGPKEVGGSYSCSNNENLESLKGVPENIKGGFYCSGCNIISLEDGPKEVGGSYYCSNNKNLESLKGICKATEYILPEGFTIKDVEKELKRQKLFRGISDEEADLLDALF